jgi:glycosyltransferase involved in cell wall biosynthesis
MRVLLFAHPEFLPSESMSRFAAMIAGGLQARGITVETLAPKPIARRWISRGPAAKWAGYVDAFVLFPIQARRRIRSAPGDTLFVFSDQALGPWVPLVRRRPHVVHCHDLLALRSALGHFPENPTGWTGRLYQRFIRAGFGRARHFICVSEKSRSDLHAFGRVRPLTSEVVYNGLSQEMRSMPYGDAMTILRSGALAPDPRGMILHVGADVWYKNRDGALRIYRDYAESVSHPLPLWIVGAPGHSVNPAQAWAGRGEVRYLQGLSSEQICAAYSVARALLFPSIAEGFGWPIAEAMACGCPVLTTEEAPMTEVGGDAVRYIPRLKPGDDVQRWASRGARKLFDLLSLDAAQRSSLVDGAIARSERFSAKRAIEGYLGIYRRVFELERGYGATPGLADHRALPSAERPG